MERELRAGTRSIWYSSGLRHIPAVLVVLCVIGAAIGLAWQAAEVAVACDDAFISFRYADNLARGRGIVYSPPDRVEGYTNFLWVVMVAAGIALGAEPLETARLFGICGFACAAALSSIIVWRATNRGWQGLWALLPLALVQLPSQYAAHGGNGLEMTFASFLLLLLGYVNHVVIPAREWTRPSRAWVYSLIPSALLLTRMDTALFVGVSILVGAALTARPNFQGRAPLLDRALHEAVYRYWLLGVVVVAWLIWKVRYYGDILPNTYYAKGADQALWEMGWSYWADFVRSYFHILLLVPVAIFGALHPPRRSLRGFGTWALVSIVLYVLYTAKAGGDFMHYRFAFMVYPMLTTLAVFGLYQIALKSRSSALACGALILALAPGEPILNSKYSAMSHGLMHKFYLEGVRTGKAIRRSTPHDIRIATTLAGTMAYFGDRYTVDQLGLNDARVARIDVPITVRGHSKRASREYLQERQVHLLFDHPWFIGCELAQLQDFKRKKKWTKESNPIVLLRVDDKQCVIAEYLVQNPEMTRWFCEHPEYFLVDGIRCGAASR